MLNNRGQISETMTWIIATIVIVVVLIISVYASILLAKKTNILNAGKILNGDGAESSSDFLETKSLQSYFLTPAEKREEAKIWVQNNKIEFLNVKIQKMEEILNG